MRITIDGDFIRVGGKSYPIDKIDCVETGTAPPRGRIRGTLAGLAATALLGLSVGAIAGNEGLPAIIAFLGPGLILGGISYQMLNTPQPYQLTFVTTAGRLQAFQSDREQDVLALRDQIEGAIASRSLTRRLGTLRVL